MKMPARTTATLVDNRQLTPAPPAARPEKRARALAAGLVLLLFCCPPATRAQVNSWTNAAAGYWDFASGFWSLGVAPTNTHSVFITNAASKTVTIDGVTSSVTNRMTVSNLTVSGVSGAVNMLSLNGAGTTTPLRVLNAFTLGTNSALTINNGAVEVRGQAGGGFLVDSAVTLTSGSVTATNPSMADTRVGNVAPGSFLLSGGNAQFYTLDVGHQGGAPGMFTQTGGSNTVNYVLSLGYNPGGSGTYNLSNGALAATYSWVGYYGTGVVNQVSGTNSVSNNLSLGISPGSSGTYNLSSNGLLTAGNIYVGDDGTGVINQTGGTNLLNNYLNVGYGSYYGGSGNGTYNLSAGLLSAYTDYVGYYTTGVVNQTGGSNINSSLYLGSYIGSRGIYNLANGQLSSIYSYVGSGGSGLINQTGGTNTVSYALYLGYYADGAYNLNYGRLNAGGVVLGYYGDGRLTNSDTLVADSLVVGSTYSGTFVSQAGSAVIHGELDVGYYAGSSGSVRVTPSGYSSMTTLSADSLNIGGSGTGSYYQNGYSFWSSYYSSATVGSLAVGYGSGGSGQFCLDSTVANFSTGSATVAAAPGCTGFVAVTNNAAMTVTNLMTVGGGLSTTGTVAVTGWLRAGGILLNGGGNLIFNSGTINGASGAWYSYTGLTNRGIFQYYTGSLGARIYNYGELDIFSATFAPSQGMVNYTIFAIPTDKDIQFNGLGLDNQGTMILAGSVLNGNGGLTNNNLLTGYGTIAGGVGFVNNGAWQITGGNLALTSPGANFNAGELDLSLGSQLQLTGGSLGNSGSVNLNGGTVLGANGLLNNADGIVSGRGIISAPFVNNGGLALFESGTLNVTRGFANNNLVALGSLGANLSGGALTNLGAVEGFGNVASPVINQGTVEAIGGTLNFSGPVANPAGGLIAAGNGNKVLFSAGLPASDGIISLAGGVFDNNSHPLQNNGQLDGYGTFRSGGLRNNGSVTFSGGSVTVNGSVTNLGGKIIHLVNNNSLFTGNVVNNGTFKTTGAGVTFAGSYTENGAFISDPSTNSFVDLALGTAGYLVGHAGDLFLVSGSLYNGSQQQLLWDTSAAALTFAGGGAHQLQLAGADRGATYSGYQTNFAWQTVRLGAAQSLVLANGSAGPGGALYTRRLTLDGGLAQIAAITGNGHKIYYDPQDTGNAYLAGQTYALSSGGMIAPIAQPAILITQLNVLSNQHAQLICSGIPYSNHTVLASTNLAGWSAIGSANADASGHIQFEDATAAAHPTRFYRLSMP